MYFDKLKNRLERTCNTCTMCCQGYLKVQVFDQNLHSGIGCKFLKELGCSVYHSRPDVCREFKCSYIYDRSVPEWLKPEFSKVIMLWRYYEDLLVLEVIECGEKMSENVLQWLLEKFLDNKLQNILIMYDKVWYHATRNQQNFDSIQNSPLRNDIIKSAKNLPFFAKTLDNLI